MPPLTTTTQIPTPTWQLYIPPPFPPGPTATLDDAHYNALHSPLAHQERARWLPPPQTPTKASPKAGHNNRPLFPTPTESIPLIAAAISEWRAAPIAEPGTPPLTGTQQQQEQINERQRSVEDKQAVSTLVDRMAETFSRIDTLVKNESSVLRRLSRNQPSLSSDVLGILKQVRRLLKNGQSRLASPRVAELSYEPSHQTPSAPPPASASASASASAPAATAYKTLADAICARIDAAKYPEWKRTFSLHKDYHVEGRRPNLDAPSPVARTEEGRPRREGSERRRGKTSRKLRGGVTKRRGGAAHSGEARRHARRSVGRGAAKETVRGALGPSSYGGVKVEPRGMVEEEDDDDEDFYLDVKPRQRVREGSGLQMMRGGVEYVQQGLPEEGEDGEDEVQPVFVGPRVAGSLRRGEGVERADGRQGGSGRRGGVGRRTGGQVAPIIVELDDDDC